MASRFSDEAIAAIGFRSFAPSETISAKFTSAHVLAIEGITVQDVATVATKIKENDCKIAIGPTVNATCMSVVGDAWVDDEGAWEKEKNCRGPYAIISFGPTGQFTVTSGKIKEEVDGSIVTYECFSEAKSILKRIADETLPELLSALTCKYSPPGRSVRFRPVETAVAGVTLDGRVVRDIRFTISGHGYTSIPMDNVSVQARLTDAVSLAMKLNVKVARFFGLALLEKDLLKRFLYFFLALEVQTHKTFSAVDHSTKIRAIIPSSVAASQSVADLFKRHTDNMKNLRDRFIWCAMCSWTSIGEPEVNEFKRLKDIRDSIAHGEIDAPNHEDVRAIEALVIKVLSQ